MTTLLSVITSVKDYIEIAHKLIEVDSSPGSQSLWLIQNYTEFGAFLTYFLITLKQFCIQLFSFHWLKNIWSLPVIVPEIASAMVSEISVLDGFFHNAFTFLDTPLSYGQFGSASEAKNFNIYAFEKFFIGFVNSFFLFLPTSTAHIITIRRFVMQGLEAGYVSALGTIAGNFLWLCSIIFGWRFFVIPWLSFDIFRYVLGFILLVKYMWDCSKERRMVFSDLSKVKIFLLNFLLALTEQTSIYPFISNLSISPDGSMLETSPLPMLGMGLAAIGEGDSLGHYIFIHACYLLGILIGSLSVLKFTCWFWENPAFNLYMWVISSYLKNTKMTTSYFYKLLNFTFLYLTMVCAVSSIGYFGLDYTLTNPLGFIAQDRLIEQKEFGDPTSAKDDQGRFFPELSHLSVKPTDKNSRVRGGVRGRRERWKDSLLKYQMIDSSLYDQSMYSFLTVEDLNYGFDRFWLRRKMRNHKMNLRLLPGPLVRGLKKQLNPDKRVLRSDKETTEDLQSSGENKKYVEQKKEPPKEYEAKGVEFFRLLFEQYYHPNFHKVSNESNVSKPMLSAPISGSQTWTPELPYSKGVEGALTKDSPGSDGSLPDVMLRTGSGSIGKEVKNVKGSHATHANLGLEQNFNLAYPKGVVKDEFSALRKFARNFNTRIKSSHAYPYRVGHLPGKDNTPLIRPLWSKVGLPFTGNKNQPKLSSLSPKGVEAPIYSKKWKAVFSKLFRLQSSPFYDSDRTRNGKNLNNSRSSTSLFRTMSRNMLSKQQQSYQGHGLLLGTTNFLASSKDNSSSTSIKANSIMWEATKKAMSRQKLSKKDRQILRYRTLLKNNNKQVTFSSNVLPGRALAKVAEPGLPKMLHTLKFYLQKEEAFKRKLKFYGASVFRKLSVGNNAPFFKTMMKRFFYYYKPSLRYKRTLQSASANTLYRQGSRKKSRLAKKLTNISNTSLSVSKTNTQSNPYGVISPLPTVGGYGRVGENSSKLGIVSDRVNSITKPTHSYSVLGKKASRYRSQIYRDVLQHWYYTPFNRLLLKLDIDAFMSRQPRAHFLTKKEEHLLHQRRFLLAEHFDTVRWYTYMQHYSSMKTKIGGTKSFSSGIYNQQFQGTFKKIRHLFAITPSQVFEQDPTGPGQIPTGGTTSAGFILKFDQPLYNEYTNTKQSSLVNSSVNHEELENMLLAYTPTLPDHAYPLLPLRSQVGRALAYATAGKHTYPRGVYPPGGEVRVEGGEVAAQQTDLISESSTILGNYLFQAAPIREQFIAKLLKEKEYWKLTQFMFQNDQLLDPTILHLASSADATEGSITSPLPTVGGYGRLPSEPVLETNAAVGSSTTYHTPTVGRGMKKQTTSKKVNIQQELWVQLLRQNKRHINDREYIANYVKHRIDITAQRNEQKQAQIQLRLSRLNLWFNNLPTTLPLWGGQGKDSTNFTTTVGKNSNNNLSTGLQKSTKEALHIYSTNYADTSNILDANPSLATKPFGLASDLPTNSEGNKIQKQLQKLQPLMGKVTNAIHFLTSPIRALDKQKRTLAWWRKKQQAKYTRKTNLTRNKKIHIQINKIKTQRKDDINQELKDDFFKLPLPTLERMQKNKPSPTLEAAIDAKRTSLLIMGRAEREKEKIKREKKDYSYFTYSKSPSKFTATEQGPAKIKTSFFSKMQSSINHLFTRFFTVNYKKRDVSRYNVLNYVTGVSGVQKSNYLGTSPPITDKEGRQKLLEYVSKSPPLAKSTKKDQQKYGILQRREKTNPIFNSVYYAKHQGIQGMGKLRMLIKKIQRIKSNLTLQIWWWQHFLPNYQAEVTLQQQKSQVISQSTVTKYKPLSTLFLATGIAQSEGNKIAIYSSGAVSAETEVKEKPGVFSGLFSEAENVLAKVYAKLFAPPSNKHNLKNSDTGSFLPLRSPGKEGEEKPLQQAYPTGVMQSMKSMLPYIKPVNPVPFYAGWDEGLRKLVITNRFLSRRQAGQLLQPVLLPSGNKALKTSTGLNGFNEGAYLYNLLDMPFNAYTTEQFNGKAQTFYAPLGWRRFQFRHSILKTWFSLSPSLAMLRMHTASTIANEDRALVAPNLQASKYFSNLPKGYSKRVAPKWTAGNIANNQAQKNVHRRTKKRFSLMYSQIDGAFPYEPTGTLLTEVLPSHYMSIYDNQYRAANSRYLEVPFVDLTINEKATLSIPPNSCLPLSGNTVSFEAALPREKVNVKKYKEKIKSVPDELKCLLNTTIDNNKLHNSGLDFTLRKRIKTQRKFHRQRTISNNGLVFPRRRKFVQQVGSNSEPLLNTYEQNAKQVERVTLRWRPSSFKKLRSLKQEKNKKRATTSAARLKQLRPSEKQQVLIPAQRFQPRQGGFVWPGQYLLMEFTYLPKDNVALKKAWTRKQHDLSVDLNDRFFGKSTNPLDKPYKFQEATTPLSVDLASGFEGAIPRKYLIQKHNIKVLKKKLEKAHRSNKLQERVKQLRYMLSN